MGDSTWYESLNRSNSSTSSYTDADSDDTIVSADVIFTPEFQEEEDLQNKRTRKAPSRYGFSNMCVQHGDLEVEVEPLLVSEALAGSEAEQWKLAMQEELQSFEDNNAWELVDVPSNAQIVKCKWVLNKKLHVNDKVRYRARLVAKGFTQRRGIDYTNVFSPVVRHSTL